MYLRLAERDRQVEAYTPNIEDARGSGARVKAMKAGSIQTAGS